MRELAPEIAVTTTSEVLPQVKEYERTSTTVVNAYVKPLVRHYLGNLDAGLARTGYAARLRVMLSPCAKGTVVGGGAPSRLARTVTHRNSCEVPFTDVATRRYGRN